MDIICIGELLIDLIANEQGTLSQVESFTRFAGGAAGNVAVQVAKLGLKSGVVGMLGKDAFGAYLINHLNSFGVDTRAVKLNEHRRTTVAFISMNEKRIPDYLFFRDSGASTAIAPDDIDEEYIAGGKILYFSSITLSGEPVRSTTEKTIEYAMKHGLLVAFDLNLRLTAWQNESLARKAIFEILPKVDILKINTEELSFISDNMGLDIEAACKRLMSRFSNIKVLIYTAGKDGALIFTQSGSTILIPTNDIVRVDTTGAGDAFMGAFLCGVIQRGVEETSYTDIGKMANAAAELTIMRRGVIDAMPTKTELDKYMEQLAGKK